MNDEIRVAIAALLRIGEPGDGLLRRLVDDIGPVATRAITAAVGRGETTLDEAMAGLRSAGAEAAAHSQMRDALERWAVRAGDDDALDAGRDLENITRLGGRLVIPGDEEWPIMLDDLGPAAPLGLWVRGAARIDVALSRAVAVVGARAASSYGTKCASDLAWDLAARNITVVSGGAFGIDAAAHRAAIARESPTIAFMAGGVDRFYPAANADLFDQILATGAIVSETAPGMTPMRHRFLLRNRLIAASAQVSVIVEAGWRSGALNTARHALELSRPVAAFPGSVYSASSTGAHRLVREHEAELVTCSDDVIALIDVDTPALFDEHGPVPDPADGVPPGEGREGAQSRDPAEDLDEREKICRNALTVSKALDVGTIASRAGLTIPDALNALTALDLAGLAERRDTGWVKLRSPHHAGR